VTLSDAPGSVALRTVHRVPGDAEIYHVLARSDFATSTASATRVTDAALLEAGPPIPRHRGRARLALQVRPHGEGATTTTVLTLR
jgi:hypothetical protein